MSAPYPSWWSQKALSQYLITSPDVLDNGIETFVDFVHQQVRFNLDKDPLFRAQWTLRSLLKEHGQPLDDWNHQKETFEQIHASFFEKKEDLQRQIHNASAAVEGISKALIHQPPEKRESLQDKLNHFQEQHLTSQKNLTILLSAGIWIKYQNLLHAIDRFKQETGLTQAFYDVEYHKTKKGKESQQSGASFESLTVSLTYKWIINHCLRRGTDHLISPSIHVLTQVRLQSAQAELDVVVVRVSRYAHKPVQVLAVIEAKKNPNDLAHGFLMRQENLSWFTGDKSGYDVLRYQNRTYPHGHFDRAIFHTDSVTQKRYLFDPSSFTLFRKNEQGFFLKRLYFVLYHRPLTGLDSKELAILKNTLASSERYLELNAHTLHPLFQHLKKNRSSAFSSRYVIQLYALSPFLARHLFVLPRH